MQRMAWINRLAASAALCALFACSDDNSTAPDKTPAMSLSRSDMRALAAEVRQLTAGRGITQLPKPSQVRPALVQLGQALAFDKILSGNKDICPASRWRGTGTGAQRAIS